MADSATPYAQPTSPGFVEEAAPVVRADRRGPALRRRRVRLVGRYVVMAACAAIMIGPFVWMTLASLKTDADIRRVPPTLIPDPITGENFSRVTEAFDFWRFTANSVGIAATSERSTLDPVAPTTTFDSYRRKIP